MNGEVHLNPQQLQAVKHPSGPLLIVAGAGTGKTTVITERIKYLIQINHVDPYHIFAATFTLKASEEMLARLDTVMPLGYREPWLGTFHGLCERLLRDEGLEIGVNPGFKVMTQTDQWIFLKTHLYDFDLNYYRPLGNPNKFITALIKFFSRLADEDVTLPEFQNVINDLVDQTPNEEELKETERLQELAQAFATYQKLKYTEAMMDFGDLITLTLKLFRDRPNILKKYQHQFKYLLVDEFQDTNYAQYQLIKLLAPLETQPNLTVVGDDDQSIYKFRGASVSNILDFQADYPQASQIVLTQNYRSTQPILDCAYRSITHNDPDRLEVKLNLTKKLTSHVSQKIRRGTTPQILEFPTIDDEVAWTIQEIIRLVTQENLTYKDIAILTRAHNHLDPYVLALKRAGLPYQVVSNRGLFAAPEIKDLLIFLKTLVAVDDSQLLFQLSQSPVFDLDDRLVFSSLQQAKRKSTSLWSELQTSTDPKTTHLVKTINTYQAMAGDTPVSQLLYQFIDQEHYLKPFVETETIENQLKIKNLNLFFNHLKRFEQDSDDSSVAGFLAILDLWLEAGSNPPEAQIEDIDTISLMTIHAAKGLEFSAVFVGSLVSGRFPSSNRRDPIEMPDALIKETLPQGDEHMEEERRLMYVALTRAKRFLYLTYALDVGGSRKRRPSGFLTELELPVKSMAPPSPPIFLNPQPEKPAPRYLQSGQFVINTLSYSQLDTFKVCPLKYKYRYLLQIPAKPHHALSFGQSIHNTLYSFHQLEMHGSHPSQAELLKLYRQNFIGEGYHSPQHKADRFASGLQAMKDYFQKYRQVLGRPRYLEQRFKMTLDGTTLVGKIDRIDQTPQGTLALVDYKTGSSKSQKVVDKDEQLTIYALAAKVALHLNIATLSLYFIEGGGHQVTTTRSAAELTQARQKLLREISAIKKSTFPPKPDPVTCGYCEFNLICPFAAKPNR